MHQIIIISLMTILTDLCNCCIWMLPTITNPIQNRKSLKKHIHIKSIFIHSGVINTECIITLSEFSITQNTPFQLAASVPTSEPINCPPPLSPGLCRCTPPIKLFS